MLRGRVLQQNFRQAGAVTIKSPTPPRSFPGKLAGDRVPLPVSALLFVGRSAARRLEQYGIRTIGGAGRLPVRHADGPVRQNGAAAAYLRQRPGKQPCAPLRRAGAGEIRGQRHHVPQKPHALGRGADQISILSDNVAWRLRKYGLYCTAVQLTIRDADFRTITRQKQLGHSTHITREIAGACMALLRQSWQMPHPIRMLTVTALNLVDDGQYSSQMDLFAPAEGRKTASSKSWSTPWTTSGKNTAALPFPTPPPCKESPGAKKKRPGPGRRGKEPWPLTPRRAKLRPVPQDRGAALDRALGVICGAMAKGACRSKRPAPRPACPWQR